MHRAASVRGETGMISEGRTERVGLTSCEALPGHMIGGIEENHEIFQLIQAESGPKYESRPTKCIVQLLYGGRRAAR